MSENPLHVDVEVIPEIHQDEKETEVQPHQVQAPEDAFNEEEVQAQPVRRSQRQHQPRDYLAPNIIYNRIKDLGLTVIEQQTPSRNFQEAMQSSMKHK